MSLVSSICPGDQNTLSGDLSNAVGLWDSESFPLSVQSASIIQQQEVVDLEISFAVDFIAFYQPTESSGPFQVTEHTDIYTHSFTPTNTQTHSLTHTHTNTSHNPAGDAENGWRDWHSVYLPRVIKYVGWMDAKPFPVFITY